MALDIQHRFLIDSYHNFVEHGLQHVVDQLPEIRVGVHYIKLGECFITRPLLNHDEVLKFTGARECYEGGYTLRAMLRCNMIQDGVVRDVLLGYVPVMVGSFLAPRWELGPERGFFLQEGKAKVIVLAERAAPNRPVFTPKGLTVSSDNSPCCLCIKHAKGTLMAKLDHNFTAWFPLGHLVVLLGGKQGWQQLPGDDVRVAPFLHLPSREDAASDFQRAVVAPGVDWRDVLATKLLPHIKGDTQKLFWIMRWSRELIECEQGARAYTDRDHLQERRVSTPGVTLESVFERAAKTFWGKVRTHLLKQREGRFDPGKAMAFEVITGAFDHFLATGKLNEHQAGMVVPLDLFETQLKAFAKPLYIRNFMNEQSRNEGPRRLHVSQIGYVCVAETPAGKSIGLSKQLAYTAQITTRANDQHWSRLLQTLVVPWNIDKQRVVWNGNIVGAPRFSLQEVYDVLRANNQRHAAVLINEYQVTLDTSAGRYVRPVRLLSGLIGYIDPQMRESSTELRADLMFGCARPLALRR